MEIMKIKQLLLNVLLIGLILVAGCVEKSSNANTPEKNAPTGEAITVNTSSIDAGINDANAEQAEFAGDIDESALDLGI